MPWSEAPWPLVLAAIGLGGTGLLAPTRRIAIAHIAAAGVVGLFGAGAALSASWLTAAVLTAIAGAGVMVAVAARQIPVRLYAWLVGDWASGAAALAIPGAVVTAVLATKDPGGGPPPTEAVTVPALALGFLAVAGTLTYAAVFQVARREVSLPMTAGAAGGAAAMAIAALFAPGATAPDIWVGALLLAAAGLLFFAKSIDSGSARRPDGRRPRHRRGRGHRRRLRCARPGRRTGLPRLAARGRRDRGADRGLRRPRAARGLEPRAGARPGRRGPDRPGDRRLAGDRRRPAHHRGAGPDLGLRRHRVLHHPAARLPGRHRSRW
nr:hypothetical protein GCM10020092_097200 [Actinoplanes digitatis]